MISYTQYSWSIAGTQPYFFQFENAGNPKIYMGSADWMQRNLDHPRRIGISN